MFGQRVRAGRARDRFGGGAGAGGDASGNDSPAASAATAAAGRIGSALAVRPRPRSEQVGHQVERRRSRPGRIRCSSGVAMKRWPESHSQSSHTSAASGTWLSAMPRLRSGWYCFCSTG